MAKEGPWDEIILLQRLQLSQLMAEVIRCFDEMKAAKDRKSNLCKAPRKFIEEERGKLDKATVDYITSLVNFRNKYNACRLEVQQSVVSEAQRLGSKESLDPSLRDWELELQSGGVLNERKAKLGPHAQQPNEFLNFVSYELLSFKTITREALSRYQMDVLLGMQIELMILGVQYQNLLHQRGFSDTVNFLIQGAESEALLQRARKKLRELEVGESSKQLLSKKKELESSLSENHDELSGQNFSDFYVLFIFRLIAFKDKLQSVENELSFAKQASFSPDEIDAIEKKLQLIARLKIELEKLNVKVFFQTDEEFRDFITFDVGHMPDDYRESLVDELFEFQWEASVQHNQVYSEALEEAYLQFRLGKIRAYSEGDLKVDSKQFFQFILFKLFGQFVRSVEGDTVDRVETESSVPQSKSSPALFKPPLPPKRVPEKPSALATEIVREPSEKRRPALPPKRSPVEQQSVPKDDFAYLDESSSGVLPVKKSYVKRTSQSERLMGELGLRLHRPARNEKKEESSDSLGLTKSSMG